MAPPSNSAAKASWRTEVRRKRADRTGCGSEFAHQLAEALAESRVLVAYAALAGEPDLDQALDAARAAGKQVLLPTTHPGEPLRFGVLESPMAELPRVGTWQIRQPEPTLSAAEALAGTGASSAGDRLPAPVDTILVPGLSFSPAGWRLGNGGGFYDRTFGPLGAAPVAGTGIRVFGICYHDEIVDELPRDDWDLRVGSIVTERSTVPTVDAD
ncbi:5-formyltetrahydrofolate cyclo-ligase [Brevibacterium daeguense]|nr:5-formyltetrahydrofolate cyclo-ligase [Brevibacterium daeguense]